MQIAGRDFRVDGRLLRVARLALDRFDSVDDPEATLAALQKCGVRVDLFTFMQKVADARPRFPYTMEWDNVGALAVSTLDDWWTKQISDKTRNLVRRAERKGVAVREVGLDDRLVRGIAAIYNESPMRQGRPFQHYGKDPATVASENGAFRDESIFLAASFEGELVGFAQLVCDRERRQAGLLQAISMIRHRDKAPTNALIANAVRFCAERSIEHLLYPKFAFGKKPPDSLSDFMRHNGFRRLDLPRYYLPLTAIGRRALRFGLQRRVIEHIPEPLAARLREIRLRWYRLRFRSARG